MCPPVALLAAGTALQVGSGIQQGIFAGALANYNARIQEQQADDLVSTAHNAAQRARLDARIIIGRARARLGASGVSLDVGNAAAIQDQTDAFGEIEALSILSNADRQAHFLRLGARHTRFEGRSARANAFGAALGAGVSGAGDVLLALEG